MSNTLQAIYNSPKFQDAVAFFQKDAEHTIDQQIELVQISSFSNHEENRAAHFKKMIEAEGYEATMDEVCNVQVTIPGTGDGPTVLVSAHLDTVFPPETDLTVKRDGIRICCPGIGDDTRGCAEVLSLLRGIREAGIKPVGTLILGGNVGEEGLGNLRGVRHIFANRTDIDAFVSIDSAGPVLCYGGTGSYRYKVHFHGYGGHSNGDFGLPNPIHAMGRAISAIAKLEVPKEPRTTFNVGVVEGGTSVNSIAHDCSMLIDMRSNGTEALETLNKQVLALIEEAVQRENDRWVNDKKITYTLELMGYRPAGAQSADAPIVQTYAEAIRMVGCEPNFLPAASTDANIPLSLGIPAVTVSGGGNSGDAHTITEWFDPTDSHLGSIRNLLAILALVGMDGVSDPVISKRG